MIRQYNAVTDTETLNSDFGVFVVFELLSRTVKPMQNIKYSTD